ncbi:PH domain-containing protein [Mucilaginibacter sp. 14171R-50]|uniref:PH domain-containing protein n=1 Tax=Mucilaginibacter sp. 14171R-50 TaxID=2703789 RepID=UPI00138D4B1B|nr:PH domain-containing protein [Mucilaginibacter sp. 14171R-50]QHS57590.1 PH domain-containing protein [Mucilaginibacter sp. 14171R-50]
MDTTDQIYTSKKGFVIYCVLGLISIMLVSYCFHKLYLPAILCFAATGIIILPIVFNTNYTITGTGNLKVRCGFFVNLTIPVADIKKITPCKTILSAPALSFDRLEVFYNKYDSVVISPVNADDFIAKLQALNPAIEYTHNAS